MHTKGYLHMGRFIVKLYDAPFKEGASGIG